METKRKPATLVLLTILALMGAGLTPRHVLGPATVLATQAFTPSEDGYALRHWARFAVEGVNHNAQSLRVQSTPDDFSRSYLKFDLSSFPAHQGATTATLRLYKTAGPDTTYPLDCCRIEEDWHENTLGTTEAATPWL